MATRFIKAGRLAGLALIAPLCGSFLTSAQVREGPPCTCRDGRSVEAGMVSYSRDSGRESVLRVEADMSSPHRPCRAIWIGQTEVHPAGTPYEFHLQRMTLREKRFDGCNYPVEHYVKRNKTYQFIFDPASPSIQELRRIDI
jgi:hypothetical protein